MTDQPNSATAQEAEPKAIGRVRGAVEYARARGFHLTRVQTADLDVLLAELSESRARAVQGEQDEREACALVCRTYFDSDPTATPQGRYAARRIHDLILARTSTPTPVSGRNDSDAE